MAKANTNKTFFSIIFLLTIYYYDYTCPNYDALSDNLERNRIAKLGKGMEQAKCFADFFQLDVASQKLTNELIIRVLHKTQHHKHSINAAMRSQKGHRSAWPHCVLP